ncbi:MAG: histidine--tRNA ligase [Fimbriimonadaceae bacterium]|nr:histidine--tRNA ligase [Fimbriimonadaceae bacterium]
MPYQLPRGTQDILPGVSAEWRRLENAWFAHTHRYGYREIRTPMFEDAEVFKRTSGETSDVVSKEMYEFRDRSDRELALKPEGTAPIMRAIIEHSLCPRDTITRLSYFTEIFRYGRPGFGRFRQGHQLGIELVGSASVLADAEAIEIASRFFTQIGIPPFRLMLNSIGRAECRARYREAILTHMATWLAEQSTEDRAKAEKNPLRLLDTKDPVTRAALEGLPPITDFLEDASRERFEGLQELLTAAEIAFELRPDVVRGLDYYTETVFEVVCPALGEELSLCGGGRYDDLIERLDGHPTPSVGMALGIERTLLALERAEVAPTRAVADVFVVGVGVPTETRALVRRLRDAGVAVEWDIESRSMRSQMRQADKSEAKYALILGEDEVAQGKIQLKSMGSGESTLVDQAEIVTKLLDRLV